MIYKCLSCLFLFDAAEPPDRCPDCGKLEILLAGEREEQDYWRYRQLAAIEMNEPNGT